MQDLSERGLLDSTIVWWCGEFGRTPKVMWEAALERRTRPLGRRSSPPWSRAAASKAATSSGASDAKGEEVKDRPVYPADLIGSIYELLGIDPDGKLPNPQGLDARVTPTAADGVKMGGRLKEIM